MAPTHEQPDLKANPRRAARPGLRRIVLITLGVIALVVAAAVYTPADRLDPDTAIAWQTDILAASENAEREGKPVLMHFTSEYCGPCQQMRQWVYPRRAVAALIGERYIPLLVDLTDPNEQQMTAAGKLNVQYIPTIIVFSPDGREIKRHVGGMSASQLTDLLQTSLAEMPARTDSVSKTGTPSKENHP